MRDFVSPNLSPSPEQRRKEWEQIRRSAQERLKNPEAVRAFLLKFGFITKDNQLSKQYRD